MYKKIETADSGYITHACSNCQKRHTKCGGEKPTCAQCAAKELDCSYLSSAKRGPKKKDSVPPAVAKKMVAKRRAPSSKKPLVLKEIIAVARDKVSKSESQSMRESLAKIADRIKAKSSISTSSDERLESSESEEQPETSTSCSKDSLEIAHSSPHSGAGSTPKLSPDSSVDNYDVEIQDLVSTCMSSFDGFMVRPPSHEKAVIAALRFLGDSGKIIPNAFEFDVQRISTYWKLATMDPAQCTIEMEDLGLHPAEGLLFTTVMAHGFRSLNSEELSNDFMARSERIFHSFARKSQYHADLRSANCLNSAFILMAVYAGASRNLEGCAKYFSASNDIASKYSEWVQPSIQYRSYSAMLGMSTNPRDRYNWFTKTRLIGHEGQTLANKTVLAFMWICPPLVVGQNNIYLSALHARTQVENVLILSFLDEIEADLVAVSQQRRQGETSADTIDYIATFWTVARALRVIVYARMHSPATVIINTVSSMLEMFNVMRQGRQLTRIPFLPLTVSYALGVVKDHDIKLWKYGVSLLAQYGSHVPAISSAPQLSQQKPVNNSQPDARPADAMPQRDYISYRTIEERTAQKGFSDIDIFGSGKK
eukprot:TRINITY_DN7834_c0_g1_i1.p1 TRINITY_DN7834_c0_g1~~TRINITY_DN7834_c0_g1_i1.p1  ORF type:complete len:595 (-),score=21.86 TRINITY_DN7834_c0_g1_i1:99-1883(-)